MKISSFATVAFVVVLASASVLSAGTLTLTIEVDKAEYMPGEDVTWDVYVSTDADANDHGISAVAVDLFESQPTQLIAKATSIGPDFSLANGYVAALLGVPTLGTENGNSLVAVGEGQAQNGGNALHRMHQGGGPTLLATGSYVATAEGLHVLTADVPEATSATYWTAASPGITNAN